MDFMEALEASGLVIFILLIISLFIYQYRVREIYGNVAKGTQRALWGYGFSGLGMSIATIFGLYEPFRFLIMGIGALFLGSILFAQLWILFTPERAQTGSIIIFALVGLAIADNIIREFLYPELTLMMSIIPLTILLIGSIFFSVVLVRESPSTFTVSIFVMMLLYMLTWVLAASSWTIDNPQFYLFQTIPLVVAVAIFGSVRRPLRITLSLFMVLLMITISIPLIYASTLSGEVVISSVVLTLAIVVLCFIAPLNYFVEQAAESGARTPRYLAMVVAFVSILVVWHSLGWAMFITDGIWNQYMIWIDIVLGSLAVIAFLLSAVASGFGEWVYAVTRETSIVFGTMLGMLSFPIIQSAMVVFLGISDVTVYNNYLLIAIVTVVLLGFILFSRIAFKLYKAGAASAAQRLMLFLLAAITTAFTTMVSDDLYAIGLLPLVIALLLLAALLALASSPPFTARFRRFMQQRRIQEKEEIPVESTVKW